MQIKDIVAKWEDVHSNTLNEYSKGHVNNEVMQMHRTNMKQIQDFISDLKSINTNVGQSCKCGNDLYTRRHGTWYECTDCNKIEM